MPCLWDSVVLWVSSPFSLLASRLRAGLPLFVCKHDFFDNAAFERIRQVGQEPDSVHNSQEDHDYSALSPSFLSCADTFQSVDACARRPDWRLGGPPPMGMGTMMGPMQGGAMPLSMHMHMQRMPGYVQAEPGEW